MRANGRPLRLAASAAVAIAFQVAISACSPSEGHRGAPTKVICGETIGQAALLRSQPWYVDGRQPSDSPVRLLTSPDLPQTWIQVSSDCQNGSTVSIRPSGVARIVDAVRTSDGNYAAVRVRREARISGAADDSTQRKNLDVVPTRNGTNTVVQRLEGTTQ